MDKVLKGVDKMQVTKKLLLLFYFNTDNPIKSRQQNQAMKIPAQSEFSPVESSLLF